MRQNTDTTVKDLRLLSHIQLEYSSPKRCWQIFFPSWTGVCLQKKLQCGKWQQIDQCPSLVWLFFPTSLSPNWSTCKIVTVEIALSDCRFEDRHDCLDGHHVGILLIELMDLAMNRENLRRSEWSKSKRSSSVCDQGYKTTQQPPWAAGSGVTEQTADLNWDCYVGKV